MTVEVLAGGVYRKTSGPVYGQQDLGLSPQGAMDRFSYETGNALLENPSGSPAFEILIPPVLKFSRETLFVLTGARRSHVRLTGSTSRPVEHGTVCRAFPGDILEFGEKVYGLKTYLCYKRVEEGANTRFCGRQRGEFSRIARWPDPLNRIRVLDGPEIFALKHPDEFFTLNFMIQHDSNDMGLRLQTHGPQLAMNPVPDMISAPVADGTIQLTPGGPVVLLRKRQTLGGYPRIFNVITPDLDLLAQYAPGEYIRFKRVTHKEALHYLKLWHEDLASIYAIK